jgi:cytoskeletal protein RodZ
LEEQDSLGKYFKSERETQKISLKEVAKNTKVREHILRAIEEDQHDLFPHATYVKGFLLSYARFLRLDPNEILLRYQRGLKAEPDPHPLKQPYKKKLWSKKQTWVVGGTTIVGLIGFYFFSSYFSFHPAPQNPVIEEKLPLTPFLPFTETTSVPEGNPFTLQLKAVEETWVSLRVNDQPEKEMTFKPGEAISVQASNQIRVILGNAGGLDFILNGNRMEKFGKSGEVITLFFTPQGVEVKRHEKATPIEKNWSGRWDTSIEGAS